MKLKDESVIVELKKIARRDGGILQPTAVVEAARPATSPLHSHFDWNDTEAAQKWRIHQARNLINICVEYIGPKDAGQETRVFVSLRDERGEEGGYRSLVSVLKDDELRVQMLADALEELRYFKAKYGTLKELANVFAAIDETTGKLKM